MGGRFYERFVDGDELQVGIVTACEPHERIVFTWAPPVWPGGTEVEVRFAADGDHRTVVHVEHRGFENLGADNAATGDQFGNGWPTVLDAYAGRVEEVADGAPERSPPGGSPSRRPIDRRADASRVATAPTTARRGPVRRRST